MRKFLDYLKMFLFLFLLAAASGLLAYYTSEETVGVARVIDGDSIRINGREIRLFGIDAPEARQSCRSKTAGSEDHPCGRLAAQHLKNLVRDMDVTCRGNEEDKYGRLLGTCTVDDLELNAAMVRDGHAVSFGAYETEEAQARRDQIGLWAGDFDLPRDWRRQQAEKHQSDWLSSPLGW